MIRVIFAVIIALVILPEIASAQSCQELRQACMMKDQLGERGRGNCRAFREQCQQPQVNCAEMRARCMFKDQIGERGQGNCRAYREACT